MRDYACLYTSLLSDLGLPKSMQGGSYQDFTSDMSPQYAARMALAGSFYKKLAPAGTSKDADAAALTKFEQINASIPEGRFEFQPQSEMESLFWDYFIDNYRMVVEPHESLPNFDLDFIREHMWTGPGAAQGADSTYVVSKLFESNMTYTDPYLLTLYRGALVGTDSWMTAEKRRYELFGNTQVRGGKLFFAPKNADISRTCCTEANINLIIQMAVGAFLELRCLHFFGISLSTQPDNNRELARIGSIDGSFGTQDLVSASDSIQYRLFERIHPDGFLKAVMKRARSERAVLPDGREVELRMISTMGNGFTFPLQTVIFACAVRAVYTVMGFPCKCPRTQFGVFGDDIIVRREAYEFLAKMLSKLGFQVNMAKSFNTGAFRESCGHDYFAGCNIRGVYVRSLETRQQVYSIINRLARWSAVHEWDLTSTIKQLLSWVPDLRVPPSLADDSGIHVPFKLCKPKLDSKYWFKYRYEKRLSKRKAILEPDSDRALNPAGLALGFLVGAIRRTDVEWTTGSSEAFNQASLWVTEREPSGARPRYRVATSSIPWWDFLADAKMPDKFRPWEYTWRVPINRNSYDIWSNVVVAALG